jgi:hypothetical protein
MRPRYEFIAALRGEKVDRPPLFLREGYEYWRDYKKEEELRIGWMADPRWKTVMDAAEKCKPCRMCQVPVPIFNRYMMTQHDKVKIEKNIVNNDLIEYKGKIDTGKKVLTWRDTEMRGMDMQWYDEVPVKDYDDVEALISMPFELDEALMDTLIEKLIHINNEVIGTDAVYQLMFPDPIVAISRCMHFEMLFEMTLMEKELLIDALKVVADRLLKVAKYIGPKLPKDIVIWSGGAEQCTPPLMAPTSFDEYVLPYTKPIVDEFKKNGFAVVSHCHGKVKHALDVMCRIGIDGTEPVEPPPQGNVTMGEAFEITKGRMTMIGNLEWLDLDKGTEQQITERMEDLAQYRNERLIIAASAGPTSALNDITVRNHLKWFDEYERLFM